jgi:hypothetical protein
MALNRQDPGSKSARSARLPIILIQTRLLASVMGPSGVNRILRQSLTESYDDVLSALSPEVVRKKAASVGTRSSGEAVLQFLGGAWVFLAVIVAVVAVPVSSGSRWVFPTSALGVVAGIFLSAGIILLSISARGVARLWARSVWTLDGLWLAVATASSTGLLFALLA